MAIHIGTSGWSYDHWQSIVYPRTSDSKKRLEFYTRCFDTVEVNASYYAWPRVTTFEGWKKRTPDNFIISLKAPKWLSHYDPLGQAVERIEKMKPGMEALGDKAGVLLVQTAASFDVNLTKLETFLEAVPRHWKVAIELRHDSWDTAETFKLLERFQAAYCIMSGAHLKCLLRVTAPFVYVRLHGPDHKHLYGGSYFEDDMRWWASHLLTWNREGRDVFAYFNNDGHGNAVRNAQTLIALCKA